MSQFFQGVTAGSLPPSVPTSFVTDSGTAIPAGNILNVFGVDSSVNNANGIETTGSGNTVDVVLTNRVQGTATTTGAVTADVITFPLGATPGTFTFDCRIAGFDAVTPSGAGYTIVGSVRTTGAAAVLLGGQAVDAFEEAATAACSGVLTVSGNNAIFRVTGAAGLTIDWNGVMTYTMVS